MGRGLSALGIGYCRLIRHSDLGIRHSGLGRPRILQDAGDYERPTMKYVIAVIQPDKLDEVLVELTRKEVHLVTVSNVIGRGRQRGIAEVYRSHKEAGSLLRKVKLEIAVNEDFVKPTVEAILKGARTGEGQIGDGKVFVLDLADCIRIRTGETGGIAIG